MASDASIRGFADRVNLILLIPHGRAGSFFLQSLLDGHEEIILFPSYFPAYGWHADRVNDVTTFVDDFCAARADLFDSSRSYIAESHWSSASLLGEGQDEQILVDLPTFKRHLRDDLDELRRSGPLTDRLFLIALHHALALTLGRDVSRIKYILFHQHGGRTYAPHVDRLLVDFPDLYFIAMVRDLRESWASYRTLLANRWGRQNLFNFGIRYIRLNLFLYYEFLEYASRFPRGHVRVIDLHQLHLLQERAMVDLAGWLGIGHSPSLLESTFLGKKWWGNAADGKALNGFSASKATYHWKEKLSPEESEWIEALASPVFELFQQEAPSAPRSSARFYLRLLLAPPIVNWPRKDSLLYRNVQRNSGFVVNPILSRLPGSRRRSICWFYNCVYFVGMSVVFVLERFSPRDIILFEKRRRAAARIQSRPFV